MKRPKIIGRVPDWQNQKLILATKLVEQQARMIQQNDRIISELVEIRNELRHIGEER